MGTLPGLPWARPPGVPPDREIGEGNEAGIELNHVSQADHGSVFLKDVLSVEELPAVVLTVMGDQQKWRCALENALQGDDLGLLGIREWPVCRHDCLFRMVEVMGSKVSGPA
jgi:hypothetical protein